MRRRYSLDFKRITEMNPEQLWTTTMDPAVRRLIQITVEDAEMADQMISVCMGEEVAPRKEFIMENAIYADLDI